jgi:hypothetical protein
MHILVLCDASFVFEQQNGVALQDLTVENVTRFTRAIASGAFSVPGRQLQAALVGPSGPTDAHGDGEHNLWRPDELWMTNHARQY